MSTCMCKCKQPSEVHIFRIKRNVVCMREGEIPAVFNQKYKNIKHIFRNNALFARDRDNTPPPDYDWTSDTDIRGTVSISNGALNAVVKRHMRRYYTDYYANKSKGIVIVNTNTKRDRRLGLNIKLNNLLSTDALVSTIQTAYDYDSETLRKYIFTRIYHIISLWCSTNTVDETPNDNIKRLYTKMGYLECELKDLVKYNPQTYKKSYAYIQSNNPSGFMDLHSRIVNGIELDNTGLSVSGSAITVYENIERVINKTISDFVSSDVDIDNINNTWFSKILGLFLHPSIPIDIIIYNILNLDVGYKLCKLVTDAITANISRVNDLVTEKYNTIRNESIMIKREKLDSALGYTNKESIHWNGVNDNVAASIKKLLEGVDIRPLLPVSSKITSLSVFAKFNCAFLGGGASDNDSYNSYGSLNDDDDNDYCYDGSIFHNVFVYVAHKAESDPDILSILRDEMEASIGFCEDGALERMLNVLAGIDDKVKTCFSLQESLANDVYVSIYTQYTSELNVMYMYPDLKDCTSNCRKLVTDNFNNTFINILKDYDSSAQEMDSIENRGVILNRVLVKFGINKK